MPKRRITDHNRDLLEAVAMALRAYRDGGNPERRQLSDTELARQLGVSKSTVSKYLSKQQFIGGEALVRMLAQLRITLTLGSTTIIADDSSGSGPVVPVAQQISFVFERPCFVEETPERVGIAMARSSAARLTVEVKVAS